MTACAVTWPVATTLIVAMLGLVVLGLVYATTLGTRP